MKNRVAVLGCTVSVWSNGFLRVRYFSNAAGRTLKKKKKKKKARADDEEEEMPPFSRFVKRRRNIPLSAHSVSEMYT